MPNERASFLPTPYSIVPEGLKVHVQLTPKAKHERLDGIAIDAEGGAVLKMSVTAVPEMGKANKAMIKALAKTWRLPKTQLSVITGSKNRRKTVLIEGEGAVLAQHISQWLNEQVKWVR